MSAEDFNAAAQNEWTVKLLEAMRDNSASKGSVFGLKMRGADLSAQDSDGWTPLMYALKYKNEEVLELLLYSTVDPNAQNRDGDTALMTVIRNRRKDENGFDFSEFRLARKMVREYEEFNGMDFNLMNNAGRTALMMAAASNQFDFVERLWEAGADPLFRNNEGVTALDFARANPDAASYEGKQIIALLQRLTDEKKQQMDYIDEGLPATRAVSVGKPLSFRK